MSERDKKTIKNNKQTKNQQVMKNLIERLTKELQILKIEYLEKTSDWAVQNYKLANERSGWSVQQFAEVFNFVPRFIPTGNGGFYTFSKCENGISAERNKNKCQEISRLTLENYKEKCLKKAELHFLSSVEKLAGRITKKGLNIDNLEMKTGRVGVNIETLFSDGKKNVKAWTIVASGEIQQPHFRYLVK